jgi:small GTP-binding protein
MIGVEPIHTFKFIVIGSMDVGKTSLLKRLIDDDFSAETSPTVGVHYMSTSLEIDGHPIKLQLWDTAGQEKFRSIAKSYFRHAVGVVLVFAIDDRRSFDDLSFWLNDVHQLCQTTVRLLSGKCEQTFHPMVTAYVMIGNYLLRWPSSHDHQPPTSRYGAMRRC